MNLLLKEEGATKYVVIIFFLFFFNHGFAQSVLDKTITFSAKEVSINNALIHISNLTGTEISFSNRFFEDHDPIDVNFVDTNLKTALQLILTNTDIDYKLRGNRLLLFRKRMLSFTVSGFIEDKNTGERLIAATIYCPNNKKGTTTNEYGFYSLTLPQGETNLVFSYIGYQSHSVFIDLKENARQNIKLQSGSLLEEIVVTPGKNSSSNFRASSNSRFTNIDKELSTHSPDLGGVVDPIRSAQLLAGIQSGTDGLEGLYVRGGNSGQNLMMMDGVPVYIPYHLLGVFSVYNNNIINSSKLFKGNFPAAYGGRLSSVFDIRTREGNHHKWGGNVQSNLISVSALAEGPIIKEKSALLMAGRISYPGFLLNPFFKRTYFNSDTKTINSLFYDYNLKFNYTFSNKDRIYASFYRGLDSMNGSGKSVEEYVEQEDVELSWANSIASVRWNHLFSDKLFSNTTVTYSFFDYQYSVLDQFSTPDSNSLEMAYFIDIYSNNNDLGIKSDFDYIPSARQHIKFGSEISIKEFTPELTFFDNESGIFDNLDNVTIDDLEKLIEKKTISTTEFNLYFENQIRLSNRWYLNLGMRASSFLTKDKDFLRLEPRIFTSYTFSEQLSGRASISRMIQYLHLVSHTSVRLPNDIWLPSDKDLKPEEAWQGEFGLDYQLHKNTSLSLEGYYKGMKNLFAFSEDYVLKQNVHFKDFLVKGRGIAMGLEFSLRFMKENYGFLCSYTLASSTRHYKQLNSGFFFPHARDFPSQIKIFGFRKIGKNLNLSLNWVYNSGGPAINITSLNGFQGTTPTPPQNYLPTFQKAYHRLDISAGYSLKTNRFQHNFKAGFYNLYNRKNFAYYRIDIDKDGNVNYPPVYGIPFRPSISYQLKY